MFGDFLTFDNNIHSKQTNVQVCTSRSGRLNSIFLSNLPGLVRAGSRVSGLEENNT